MAEGVAFLACMKAKAADIKMVHPGDDTRPPIELGVDV